MPLGGTVTAPSGLVVTYQCLRWVSLDYADAMSTPKESGAVSNPPTSGLDTGLQFPDTVIVGYYPVIGSGTRIGDHTRIGHHVCIGSDVHIGSGCEIGSHVVIHDGSRIGEGVRIDDGAVIGKQPMRAANSAVTKEQRQPPAVIGARCLIGANSVLYAGCRLGEKVLVADLATIREDVSVGDFTIVGRGVSIENKCSVGRYCKLETNAYITAYSTIEDRVFVAPGVLTSNDNFLGRTEERFRHFRGATLRRGARV